MSALSDRLKDARSGRSIDAIAAQAAAQGCAINRATVAQYLRGEGAKNPSESVLQGLAAGFGIDLLELRALAGLPEGELEPYVPPAEANRLDARQRQTVDELIRLLAAKNTPSHEREGGGSE